MRCPHHARKLQVHLIAGREVFLCRECSGHWIPGNRVQKLLGENTKKGVRRLSGTSATSLDCPYEGAGLHELTVQGVTIDVCSACGGLWLDRGELVRLRRKSGRLANRSGRRRSGKHRKKRSASKILGEVADALLSGLIREIL